jgi:hypothetical protein
VIKGARPTILIVAVRDTSRQPLHFISLGEGTGFALARFLKALFWALDWWDWFEFVIGRQVGSALMRYL